MKLAEMSYSQLLTALEVYKGHLTLYRMSDKTWCVEFTGPDPFKSTEVHGATLAVALRELLEKLRVEALMG